MPVKRSVEILLGAARRVTSPRKRGEVDRGNRRASDCRRYRPRGFGRMVSTIAASSIASQNLSLPFLVTHTVMRCGGGPWLHRCASSPAIMPSHQT